LTTPSEEDSLLLLELVPQEAEPLEEDFPGAAEAAPERALDELDEVPAEVPEEVPEEVLAENAPADAGADGSPSPCAPELVEASPASASLLR
jgi:hypothetical protein